MTCDSKVEMLGLASMPDLLFVSSIYTGSAKQCNQHSSLRANLHDTVESRVNIIVTLQI